MVNKRMVNKRMVNKRMVNSGMVNNGTRLLTSGIVVVSLFLALFARLFYLQVIEEPILAAAAQANQVRTVYEEAPRGRILDRNGVVLVGNRESDAITVDRDVLTKDKTLPDRLAAFLGTDKQSLLGRANDSRVSIYKPAIVATGVDKGVVATFRERQNEFQGVSVQTLVERWYPNGPLGAHVLGYVGEINDGEMRRESQVSYRLGDEIGKSGVEASYEKDLRGRPGASRIEVDSSGRPVRVLEHTAPIPGNDVYLSIGANVQRAAEEALQEGINAVRSRPGVNAGDLQASGGSVVAVDPRNGNLIAMASYPAFDPASFAGGISAADYQKLVDPNGPLPLNNRAIGGTYAPGSTFKLVTAIAGLKTGVIGSGTIVNDGGAYFLGGKRLQNAQNRAYGPVDMPEALTVSSDVYFYGLGDKLWAARKSKADAIQQVARGFGLGSTQQAPLSGEVSGRIPDPASRKKLHEDRPDVYPEGNWYAGDNVNLAIGQGDTLVTPLQLVDAYAGFAAHGVVHVPRIVVKVTDPSGRVLRETGPKQLSTYEVPNDVHDPIEKGLRGAVGDSRGTAYAAFKGFDLKSFPIAGKTGTAQVNGKDDTALFAGYGPVGNPEIAVSVVIEQGGFGSQSAAPVARKVFSAVSGQPDAAVKLESGVD